MRISTWSKLGLVFSALLLTGQACTINIGSSTRADGGVFRSDDHGQSWTQKNFVRQDKKQPVYLDDVTGRTLVFDQRQAGHIFLGTLANGIWETSTAGDQWQSTSLRSGAYDCLSLDPLNSQVIYTASGSNVLKSVDGGQTWKAVYTESQPLQVVDCVLVNPVIDNEIWATTSGGKMLFSEDYGQHWTLMYSLPPMQPRLLYIPRDNAAQLYVLTRNNGIYRSDNRGQKWTDLTINLPPEPGLKDIRAVDINPARWFIATAGGLYKSLDRAQTWTAIPTLVTAGSVPIQNVAVNPTNAADILVTTEQRLQHTTDGGATWSVITLPTKRLPTLLAFDPRQADRLFFATFKQPKK